MLLNVNTDVRDGSRCTLRYDETHQWLHAIWQGFIDPAEAQRGAVAYLRYARQRPSPYLLNDNLRLQGPWFVSLDWLARTWVPAAAQLDLRYVAHIVQADQPYDILSLHPPANLPFELQIFTDPADARQWLRDCQVPRLRQA